MAWSMMAKRIHIVVFCLLSWCWPAAAADTISLRVTDAPVRDVLASLAATGQAGMIIDDAVSGNITIELTDMPFATALELIVRTKGLVCREEHGAWVISTPERLKAGPDEVFIAHINHAEAVKLRDVLQPLAATGHLTADAAANNLVYAGPPSAVAALQQAVAKLDVPVRQVCLEAKVVAVSEAASHELGLEWAWDPLPAYPDKEEGGIAVNRDGKPTGLLKPGRVHRSERKGVISFGRNPEGVPYEFYYQAKINALEADGKAKVLAKPRIMAADGCQAVIFIGDHVPVVTEKQENNKTTTATEYVDAGIKLVYTPRINVDGQITAAVHTEVSTPVMVPEVKNFRITTRQADTVVRMQAGETLIIGGLLGNETAERHSGIPFLQELPLIGKLFQSNYRADSSTELVIFLTATLA